MPAHGRDRLRELLDAVLDEDNATLGSMAASAYSSPFHFSRRVARDVGEPPAALRRRVLLERAAWQVRHGASVTDAAFAAGYESVEGFSRAFARAYGHPPSAMPPGVEGRGHWLPAPNGIHFHSPTVLYVAGSSTFGDGTTASSGDLVSLLVRHDVDDIAALLDVAKSLSDEDFDRVRLPGNTTISWDGYDESLSDVLHHLVFATLPWMASIDGDDLPDVDIRYGPAELADRYDEIGPRWLAAVRDIDRRDAWADSIIDALCDPPESFVLAQIVGHVLTFSAHRRQLARTMFAQAGIDTSAPELDPDPITWQRRQTGGE
ncbi:helix-turn-helix domain-containing protein [Gordonia aichiensis]|uniref:Putative AraC family transcriptional regulator n=1 Tax=Gordonia aichiensis NBRC 108223 TaxID=1220583 RepID=L7KHN2_9ACTN|nr:helix-turn-helix domain-containing protein [Gordonia aichiensis]GAC48119.1 putative AraC family transcriptional regulator [Gordonia aichiensis NBRC 108223]